MPDFSALVTRSVRTLLAVGLFFTSAAAVLAQQPASRLPDVIDEQKLVTLKGNVSLQARPQNDRGQVQGSLPMERVVLVLKRGQEQEKALQSAIQAMHDPHSDQFHKWLTPAQFGKLYGPSDADIAKLKAWLSSHGFQVQRVAQGRGTIEFSGTADAVSGAFHTQIHSYMVDGAQHYANATEPKIPAALTPVVAGVLSLHNFDKQSSARILGKASIPNSSSKERSPLTAVTLPGSLGHGSVKPNFTGNGNNYVGPGDLWTIYNAAPLITASTSRVDGTGQTIAIVGRGDINSNDLVGFRANFLPAPYASTLPFTQINNGPDPGQNDDTLEQTLDVEYSSALAPAAQIDLVVSASTNSTDGVDLSASYIVDNNLAPVMSTSYGLCEALLGTGNDFYNSLWEQAAAQGITAMVSSGDNGSAGCDLVGPSGSESIGYVADEGLQVSGLASTPYNVAVGGNQFTDDSSTYWNPKNSSAPAPHTSALSYVPEKVWNESCSPLVCGNESADIAGGSGGASGCFSPTFDANNNILSCSGGYPAPDWQTGVVGLTSDNKRHLPDVSLTAAGHDGYIVCLQNSCDSGGFYSVGGTSASSPSFAGIMALVNQQTGSRQGQANYTLYRLASGEFGTTDAPNTSNLNSCNASNGNAVANSCIFHDVTTGSNAMPCDGGTLNCDSTTVGVYGTLTGYDATTGYDSATGLGSVNVANLVNHWNDAALAPTGTSLTVATSTATFGSPVSINVAVAPKTGTGTPTGTVALLTDSTLPGAIGAGSVTLTNGSFSGTVSSLPGGSYSLSARYAGDNAFASSTSTGSKIVVSPASSSITLALAGINPVTKATVSGTSIPYGSIVTGNVTLNGVAGQVAPSGTVTFFDGSSKLSAVESSPDGTAAYSATGYGLGKYTWKASYGGNSNYHGSTSTSASFTITQAPTALQLVSNTSYVVGTGSATLTAIVSADSLLLNPTGTVAFSINGKLVGTAAVSAYTVPSTGVSGAKATFSAVASLLATGSNTITASYSGDGNYLTSASQPLAIGYSATAAANTIALTATPAAATARLPVTLTATVTTGGIPATAGTVEFFDGTTSLGTSQVAGSAAAAGYTTGTATLKLILAPSSHNITANYRGILAAPTPVASSAVVVTVTGSLPSATAIAATASTENAANYDLAATVTAFGVSAPTASVNFVETSVVADLGTASIDSKNALHTFLTPAYYTAGDPTGATPGASVVADFNGDGIPDIATPNASFSSGTMSVLIGNGDGTFKTPVTYPTGIFAAVINTGDFNNDGILDIAVTCQYDSSFNEGVINVFLGNGDGTFQPQIALTIPGYSEATVVADYNRDGILDIASLQYYPNQFSVAFGNGDGTFQTPVNYTINSSPFSPYAIAGGDFNGDGAADIVEANASDGTIGVFLNNGDGTFTATANANAPDPQWISVADVNGDGKLDLLVSDYGDTKLVVLLGNGDGTFKDGISYPLNGYAATLAVGDVDGDGKPDVVAGFFYPQTGVGLLKGNGDGTFGAETDYATGQGHGFAVTLADLNGDGTADIVSADINGGDGTQQSLALLLNVTQANAKLTNVAVAGPNTTQEELQGVYSGDSSYGASSSAGVYVKGSGVKATPIILWSPASPWGSGIALGSNVLNAATSGNIAGAFTYTAQAGSSAAVAVTTVSTLTAGTYSLTATFTPVDTASYSTATATRTVVIQASDFTLESPTSALTITAGGAGTLSVTVPSLYGFSGTVALASGTPLPGGFTVTASPTTIAAGGSSTITIQTNGLNGATASLSPHSQFNGWVAGGVALSCVLIFPAFRRRKSLYCSLVGMIALLGTLNGCGGTGFTTATVTLASSATKAASGTAVSLTATATSKHSKLGGTVTFYNGSTALGTAVPLTNGTASLSVSNLPVGLDSLTAVYTGDSHNSSATSPVVQELITGQTSVQILGTSSGVTHGTVVQVTLQ